MLSLYQQQAQEFAHVIALAGVASGIVLGYGMALILEDIYRVQVVLRRRDRRAVAR